MADIVNDGNVRVTWLASLASTTTPSAADLTAGTAIESFITPDGLAIEIGDDEVDVSALNSTFTAKAAGRGTVSVEITFKDQGKANPPWTTFNTRPTGYVIVRRNLPVGTAYGSGQFVEVYTVQAGDPKIMAPAANEVAKFSIQFFSSTDPVLHAVCAA